MPAAPPTTVDVAVVGTGFAGIAASAALSRAGIGHVVLERAAGVGGTWRDNHYPGCRCDVPSHLYSLSFAPNPEWTETYSRQPEIEAYLQRTARRFGVTDRTLFGADVRCARWDGRRQYWELDTAAGPLTARTVIAGNGPLAEPSVPALPGLEEFAGTVFHSAQWRHDVDLRGKRVAVIGTGASAIQFVPEIQPEVGHLTVFQRTPPWVMPHTNRRIRAAERRLYRHVPAAQRLVREAVYWSRELFVTGLLRNNRTLRGVEGIGRGHLRTQVPDRTLRAALTPSYRPGCKRLLLSNDWYPALQQPNVSLVTEGITAVRPDGVVAADGTVHPADVIIFGTGFHVVDNPLADRIIGADGRTLADHWGEHGVSAYLGTSVSGFPNLWFLAGPNTGIGHTSLVVMIEAQLRYLVDALRTLQARGAAVANLRPTVQQAWMDEIQTKAAPTVWNAGGCASWYLDDQGRNPTIWPDYTFQFRRRTRRFDPSSYELTAPVGSPNPAVAARVVLDSVTGPADLVGQPVGVNP